MDAELASVMEQLILYKYWLLLPLAIFEGPMIAFVSGMLVSLGIFHPLIAFGILVLGDLLPDGLLFAAGNLAKKYGWFQRYVHRIGIDSNKFTEAAALWHKHPGKAVLTSKFAYGVSAPLLFMAGFSGMRARKFFSYSVSISIVHYATLMSLGYFFGSSLTQIGNAMVAIQIGVTVIMIAGLGYYFVRKYIGMLTVLK